MLPNDNDLRHKLSTIASRLPWYEQLLRPLHPGGTPASLSLADLPLMNRSALEQFYYTDVPPADNGLSVYRTSGTSTGKRKAIYYSAEDDEHYITVKIALFRQWLLASGGPPVSRVMSDMGTGHAASTAVVIFEKLGLEVESLSFELPIKEHVRRLEAYRPQLLYTMPSILDAIIRECTEPKALGILKVILVGELATPEWQAQKAAQLGIEKADILDTLGSIEIGTIAAYSHVHGRYLLVDGLYAEGLKAEELGEGFELLEEDERVLVLTSWVRDWFPALRYVTYDVVRGLETIMVDGKPRQSFRCVSKRIGPELKHGEKISLYDIEEAVYPFASDAEVRVKLQDNVLTIYIRSKLLEEGRLPEVKQAVEERIPDIGQMIRGGMLSGMNVLLVNEDSSVFERRSVKGKRVYYD
ncbi:hypothetical protein ACFO9Q_03510 [Paenibacillus sp. GCM10023252]|uniref:hypothetical protein n=1 Tax=Paenibacillus sp. GCM10023252 TaxID=3252649 RepID=UPI00360847F3